MGTDVFGLVNSKYLKIDYIKSDEEVNAETEAAVRAKYSVSDELKLHRLNAITPGNPDFTAYNTFVEGRRATGKANKDANAAAVALLKEVELLQEFGEPIKIMVRS